MHGKKRNMWLAGLMLACTTTAMADTLDTVERKLVEAFRKHRSATAKITMTARSEMPGMVIDAAGEGTLEMTRRDDQTLVRMEMKMTMTHKMGDSANEMEQEVLTIVDGEAAYTLTEMMGQKIAMKSKIDPQMTGDPKAMFAHLRKDNTLKLLPEETLDGRKTYVIEAVAKEKTEGMPTKQVFHFDQESGFPTKMAVFGADGKPTTTMAYTELKLDVSIDPDRFKFKAPPGVQIIEQP